MSQKILIIGGSSGLGRQLALSYASQGNEVAVLARRGHLLEELRQQYPGKIFVHPADLREDAATEAVRNLIGQLNGIDILIVAASIIELSETLAPPAEYETVSVNVTGFMKIIHLAWDYFNREGGGQIVGITSVAAARGNKGAPAYHASKAFQSIYLESLRVKAKHEKNHIHITELIPGYLRTAMGKGNRRFWVASVEKAARQSLRAIRKKRKRAFITKRWWLIYHIQRLLPIFIYDWVVNGNWKLNKKPTGRQSG